MKKYINHHWAAGGVVEFDTETGNIKSTTDYEWQKAPHWGTAWKQNGKWFVFHYDKDSFILQTENNIWRFTSDCKVTLKGILFLYNFKIIFNKKKLFSIWYKPKYLFFSFIDPAHDETDAESDDFFLFLFNFWQLWCNKPFSEFKHNIKKINNV